MAAAFDPAVLQNVVGLLGQTLNPLAQKQAEEALKNLEMNTPRFSQLLLTIAEGSYGVEMHVRMAAALLFKNFMEGTLPSLSEDDRIVIKGCIVNALTRVPASIQRQLGEAVTAIASIDFPDAWPDLIPQLVQRLDVNDFDNNIAILQTIHYLFKRYRTEFRSDELYTEINFVMSQLAEPLLQLFRVTQSLVAAHAGEGRATIEKLLLTQLLLNKIYYSLSAQDLPAFFEDHLGEFMDILKAQLTYRNPLAESGNDDDAGPAEKLPASVAKIAILYANRYEEEFTMLGSFVEAAWSVLTSVSRASKHDATASACMRLLSSVARQERHKSLFSGVLQLLCDKVVVPNILIRESDLELFEDEPLEYIRRSVDGVADEGSRRGGAVALTRGLMEFYETKVTAILQGYVERFLQLYASAPAQNWRDKNAAVNLFTAIAIRGSVSSLGVTKVNPLTNIQDFYSCHIFPDLQPSNAALHPLLKVDAIRFISDFRSQLDKEQHLLPAFPLIQHHLASHHLIVHTCAANAIDKLLSVKRQGQPLFSPTDMGHVADPIITTIIRVLQQHKRSAEKVCENEFLIKALLRTLSVAQTEVLLPILPAPLECITALISLVAANPSNPVYNHHLFECAAAMIVNCGSVPQAAAHIESKLLPVLQQILQQDVSEFIHYVFQLLAVMMEVSSSSSGVSSSMRPLISPTLQPSLWTSSENIPALTRFLQAALCKDGSFFVQNNMLPQVLGIFQTLLGSKIHEASAFGLIGSMVQSIPLSNLDSFLSGILMVILKRLQATKSPRTGLHFLLFLCTFLISVRPRNGSSSSPSFPSSSSSSSSSPSSSSILLIHIFDSLQPKLLAAVLPSMLLPQGPKLRDRHDRKLVILGLTRLISEAPDLLTGDAEYAQMFAATVSTIVTMITTLPAGEVEASSGVDIPSDEQQPSGSFWRLNAAPPPKRCPQIETMPDAASMFVNSLAALSRSLSPGALSSVLATMPEGPRTALSSLLQQHNLSLV